MDALLAELGWTTNPKRDSCGRFLIELPNRPITGRSVMGRRQEPAGGVAIAGITERVGGIVASVEGSQKGKVATATESRAHVEADRLHANSANETEATALPAVIVSEAGPPSRLSTFRHATYFILLCQDRSVGSALSKKIEM